MELDKKMVEQFKMLRDKYSNPSKPREIVKVINEIANNFHLNLEKTEQFNLWLKELNQKLDLKLEPANVTFFPSITFFIYYDIIEYRDFSIYKMEYFTISLVEDCFTSFYSSYIREKVDGSTRSFYPRQRLERDDRFNENHQKIIKEIEHQYPNKSYLDIQFLDFVVGDYPITYSTNLKNTLFELLFRQESE